MLRDSVQTQEPVYLATDPNTGVIQRVLIPDEQYVTRLAPLPGGAGHEVEFSNSHARHLLRQRGPADRTYDAHLAALRDALQRGTTVLVSETLDTLEILDVRPPPAPLAPPPAPAPLPGLVAGAPPAFLGDPGSRF